MKKVKQNRVQFAVMGCGHAGKRHAAMILEHPEADLVALIDNCPNLTLPAVSADIPFFSSLPELFRSGIPVDVVSIATPNGYHALHAIEALKHEKHVLLEKPMALHSRDAEEILAAARMARKHIEVVVQNRYAVPARWLKEMVGTGRLGKILFVQIQCFWNRDARYYKKKSWHGKLNLDGGTLFTQFSHFIDMLYWIFGDIDNIFARMANFTHGELTEFEDCGMVCFDLVKGGMGSFNFSTSLWDRNLESTVVVIGEQGTVKLSGQYMEKIDYCHVQNYKLPSPVDGAENLPGEARENNFYKVIGNMVKLIRQQPGIDCNAIDSAHVVNMIERIYAAQRG